MSSQDTIVVVGAGGFGAEVAEMVRACEEQGGLSLRGFLDDGLGRGLDSSHAPILGPVHPSVLARNDRVVIAIGDPTIRRAISLRLGPSTPSHTVVHPSALVSPSARVGVGCIVGPLSYVGPNAELAPHVVVNVASTVGHDVVIGAFAVLSPQSNINGHVVIDEGVFVGSGAILGVGTRVGAWSKVSAGAFVRDSIPAGSLAVGNPARARVMFRAPA